MSFALRGRGDLGNEAFQPAAFSTDTGFLRALNALRFQMLDLGRVNWLKRRSFAVRETA